MTGRWKLSNQSVYAIAYDITWCTKYNKTILTCDVYHTLHNILSNIQSNDFEIMSIKITPNTVSVIIHAVPIISPHMIIQALKTYTAGELKRIHNEITSKVPCIWTRSYHCNSLSLSSSIDSDLFISTQPNR